MNPYDFRKIEFWVSTGFYLLSILILITSVNSEGHTSGMRWEHYYFREAGVPFEYFRHYFVPRLLNNTWLYCLFLLLNFAVIPGIYKGNQRSTYLTWLFILLLVTGCFKGILLTYSQAYLLTAYSSLPKAYHFLFIKGYSTTLFIFLAVGFYVAVRMYLYSILTYIDRHYTQAKVYRECFIALVVWGFVLILLFAQLNRDELPLLWLFTIPPGILFYGFSQNEWIPRLKAAGHAFWAYLWRSLALILIGSLLVSFIPLLIYQRNDPFIIHFLANLALHALFTLPFSWIIYHYRLRHRSEITRLKTELGKSDASLSFLQSQINPHFLFNALNTLYGTALQEKAERTGEGIQKLGDMMRFMLHENMKDKILLARDIDYLENYIELQKLRTSPSANIVIETQIEIPLGPIEITPMLLIPFVENAFKHGISLQSPSAIKITLQTKGSTLYFDVHNSIHLKSENDPEMLKSGIGLQNVKQRLALLYPGKHELIIRESAKDFFVHLTMQL